jgi:anti-sigma regulatory factor (Ser/Thr protein kinase)
MPASTMAIREAAVRFTATIAGLAPAGESLRAFLDTVEIATARRYQIELAFDEIASNIIRHGQPVTAIGLTVAIHDAEAVLTFEDDGIAFDPRTPQSARQPASPGEAPVGGLGLPLVKSFGTRIDYDRTHQHNRLTLIIPLR